MQHFSGSRDSVVGTATRLKPELSGLRIPTEVGDFSYLLNAETGSGAYPGSCSVGTRVPSLG